VLFVKKNLMVLKIVKSDLRKYDLSPSLLFGLLNHHRSEVYVFISSSTGGELIHNIATYEEPLTALYRKHFSLPAGQLPY
jgi:hypothetical protein